MGIQIVSFRCVLKNTLGQVLGSTFNQDILAHSPHPTARLSALADGLKDLKKGERRRICLSAEQAYGFYDPHKVITRRQEEVSPERALHVGDSVPIRHGGQTELMRVIESSTEFVTLDGNHPLAGQDLIFEIEATAAREATPEEIAEAAESVTVAPLH